jgi:transcription initiation factor IIE alpha subunit
MVDLRIDEESGVETTTWCLRGKKIRKRRMNDADGFTVPLRRNYEKRVEQIQRRNEGARFDA